MSLHRASGDRGFWKHLGWSASAAALLLGSGCASFPAWLPSSGPSAAQVNRAGEARPATIGLVDVNEAVAQRLLARQKRAQFSEAFGTGATPGYVVGPGDVLEVSIWEAPPVALFGGTLNAALADAGTSRVTTFPEQMVSADGSIYIPFAGAVHCAGRSPEAIEQQIVQQLKGRANQPQVLVRVIRNNSANVTVVGEVAASTRVPLTARGERLLDALAAAGGVRQPVNKTSLQLTRGDKVETLPLDTIIRDPRQNIVLQPGDIITALHQPYSFTVLGAAGKNEEVNFEGQGISLVQALARAGGLQDTRADARGVFIFRFESRDALPPTDLPLPTTPDGKVPLIYRVDLKDPATFFAAQSFPVVDGDVLYISNAPAAELQKFLNIVLAVTYPVFSVVNLERISQ